LTVVTNVSKKSSHSWVLAFIVFLIKPNDSNMQDCRVEFLFRPHFTFLAFTHKIA
jgi:hypothetical protein